MQSFKVSMTKKVIGIFFALAGLTAAAAAWAFGAGLTWTGICLVVVGGPLSLLYWYMLWANPARTRITLLDEGLHIKTPPFFTAAVPWETVTRVFESAFDEKALGMGEAQRSMRFGGYVSGVFKREGTGDGQVLVVARPGPVICVDTGTNLYVLGPNRPRDLRKALAEAVAGKTA